MQMAEEPLARPDMARTEKEATTSKTAALSLSFDAFYDALKHLWFCTCVPEVNKLQPYVEKNGRVIVTNNK